MCRFYVRWLIHKTLCFAVKKNIYTYMSVYKWFRILSQYYSCQNSEFRFRESLQLTSECCYSLAKSYSYACNVQKFHFFKFKDGAHLRMESFSCKESLHTLSPGANGFPFLTTSHLMLKLIFLFFNFQKWSQSVVEVLLCSNLKDDLCKLKIVLIRFPLVRNTWLFEVVSFSVDRQTDR